MAASSSGEHLVVIGASAGGVQALIEIAAALPPKFPAPICVVQHVGANPSVLPELLRKAGPNPALHARDGEPLEPGTIYVAPPDHHLLVDGKVLRLTRGPRENHTRPAVDPLFRSAALGWGARVIGVILTGFLDDGTAGLHAIAACGGLTVVEDPATAHEPSMPQSALDNVPVDHCLAVAQIGPLLARLVAAPVAADPDPPPALAHEVAINRGEDLMQNLAVIARPSSLTCPDCGGGLWELKETRPLRYRCHTGHAFGARTLEHAQAESGEHALWSAVRSLQEREMLLRRMASVAGATGDAAQAAAGQQQADRLRGRIDSLVQAIESLGGTEPGPAKAEV